MSIEIIFKKSKMYENKYIVQWLLSYQETMLPKFNQH